MAGLTAIRAGLAARLELADPDLHVYRLWPDSVLVPCAVVTPDSAEFQNLYRSPKAVWRLAVIVLAGGRAAEAAAQDRLDVYLSPTGLRSLPAAVEADDTLGGMVDHATVTGFDQYGTRDVGGIEYIGARLMVEVFA